jgi:fucose 4-O-acetylase-like acetyltransferase
MDNIKFLLIFLVVFGHLLELFVSSKGTLIYLLIYSFHMPAFVFLTGYYARFEPKKIVLKLIIPYIIFQVLYVFFSGNKLQFTTPFWILWYLFASIIWKILIPLCEKNLKLSLIIAAVIALLAGFDDTIGYYFSLSRLIVFFPFFLLGSLFSKQPEKLKTFTANRAVKVLAVLGALAVAVVIFLLRSNIQRGWFYESVSYSAGGYSLWIRLLMLIAALLVIIFLLVWTPRRSLGFFTRIGRYTMTVYLLHGFVKLKLAEYGTEVFRYGEYTNLLIAFGLAVMMTAVFGSGVFDMVLKSCLIKPARRLIEKLVRKQKKFIKL